MAVHNFEHLKEEPLGTKNGSKGRRNLFSEENWIKVCDFNIYLNLYSRCYKVDFQD